MPQDASLDALQAPYGSLAFFLDHKPALANFRTDLIEGLSKTQKSLAPKYFYDEAGSKIFEEITRLEAYYPTRMERAIFIDNADDIAATIGPNAAVLEYGAGSPDKIRRLLKSLQDPAAFVAMDISGDHLIEGMSALSDEFEDLPIGAICADFFEPLEIPITPLPAFERWLGFFPGSTIGNFSPDEAAAFLTRADETLGEDALLLLGVDLYKDEDVLHRAYDDPEGVTAAFNKNVLRRIQTQLGGEVCLSDFTHEARFNKEQSRIEMHLKAKAPTQITVSGHSFAFQEGETIHTENSYKYTFPMLEALLEKTPWRLQSAWTDKKEWFAACLLSNS